MTYKYTTIRIQRKEALLGYIVPKGALLEAMDFSLSAQRDLKIL